MAHLKKIYSLFAKCVNSVKLGSYLKKLCSWHKNVRPWPNPIKHLQCKFNTTLFFKHFDWLLKFFNQSEWFKNLCGKNLCCKIFTGSAPGFVVPHLHLNALKLWPKASKPPVFEWSQPNSQSVWPDKNLQMSIKVPQKGLR